MRDSPDLWDVIDEEIAERMLLQHDRYEFGLVAVVRAQLDPALWYVYWRHKEAHVVLGEECEPFRSLAAALGFALSPRTGERLLETEKA